MKGSVRVSLLHMHAGPADPARLEVADTHERADQASRADLRAFLNRVRPGSSQYCCAAIAPEGTICDRAEEALRDKKP